MIFYSRTRAQLVLQPLRKFSKVVFIIIFLDENTFIWMLSLDRVISKDRVELRILASQLNLLQLNISKITTQLYRVKQICIWYLSVFFIEGRNRYLHWPTFFGCAKLFCVDKYFIDAPAKALQKVSWLFAFVCCVNKIASKSAGSFAVTVSNGMHIIFVGNQS